MNDRLKHRMSSGKIRQVESQQPSPRSHQHELATILTTLEVLFTRLQNSIEHQSHRIRNIEHGLAEVVAGKFDTLINVGVKLNDNIVRLVELTEIGLGSKTEERKAEYVCEPARVHSQQHRTRGSVTSNIKHAVPPAQKLSYKIYRTIKQIPAVVAADGLAKAESQAQQSVCLEVRIVSASFLSTSESVAIFSNQTVLPQHGSQTSISIPTAIQQSTAIGYIKRTAGHYLSTLTQQMYDEYSQGRMLHNELRAKFSWKIMGFCIGLDRELRSRSGQNNIKLDHNCCAEINTTIDSTLRTVLEFLIRKFPPSKHKIVDTELAKHIKEVKRHGEIQYEILKNAGVSFAIVKDKGNYFPEIKRWINQLISEVKRTYPSFRNAMKELFMGREGSSYENMDEEIEYEIGSKISENVEMYSESQINSPGLNIKNPQIQRVLIKWVGELKHVLIDAEEVIPSNKNGFKSVNGNYVIQLTTSRKEQLAKKLLQIIKVRISPLGTARRRMLLEMVNQVFVLVESGMEECEQFIIEEMSNLKAAEFLGQCGQAFLVELLNVLLENLNLIRKEYSQDLLESGIDLITFNILDILRCRCVGSKKDIKRIYQSLIGNPDYEVIRVKNKLNESTRDILINFKPRNSFLVCEMQLALGDSKDEINDHFCHYLYQLQRSIFPVVYEVASQIVSFDPRVSYFANNSHPVRFSKRPHCQNMLKKTVCFNDGKMRCSIGHSQVEMNFQPNELPFCCTICSRFIGAHSYMLEYLRCRQCGVSICPKCILKEFPSMEDSYLVRYANCSKLHQFLIPENWRVYCEFGTEKQLLPKIKEQLASHQYVLVYIFAKEGIKPYIVKSADQHVVSTFYTLDGTILDFKNSRQEAWNSILIPSPAQAFQISELRGYAKLLADDTPWHELEQELERRGINSVVGIRDQRTKEVLVIDIPEQLEDVRSKVKQQLISKSLKAENGKVEATVQLTSKELKDLSVLRELENPATVRSLNLWGNKLTDLPDMSSFSSLTEIVLRQNQLQSISEGRLQSLENLKLLNLQNNRLKSLPSLSLGSLTVLDVSRNELTSLACLESLEQRQLQIIFANANKLQSLPILRGPKVEVLYFIANQVCSLDELTKSTLPKLNSIQGSKNRITGALPELNFPELKFVNLRQNSITDIQAISTGKLLHVQRLLLSKNCITGAIPVFKLPSLKILELGFNRISDIANIGKWELPSLQELDISNNILAGKLPIFDFPKLLDAKFAGNAISDVSSLSAIRLNNLQRLDFSSNQLARLPRMTLLQLLEFDVGNNCLENIDRLAESRLPRLKKLVLSKNMLSGGLPELYAPHLEELFLDDNDFSSIASLAKSHLLPSLKRVSLKHNKKLERSDQELAFSPSQFPTFFKRLEGFAIRHHF